MEQYNFKIMENRLFALVVMAALLAGCTSKKEDKAVGPVPVKVMTVGRSDDTGSNSYVGTVEESYGSQLSFATLGTVAQVFADEGKAVGKGEVLATLDRATLQNSYDIALSTLHQARDAYNRLNLLYKKGSLPEIKYVEIQTQLAQAEAAERIAKKNLADCVLRAPFAGYISKRMVDVGNNVGPGIGCFQLVKIDQIKVKVSVPEKEIAGIHIGQSMHFTVSALGDRAFTGRVKEKGVQANPLSHTYDIKLELPNAGHALLPGMVCSVVMRTGGGNGDIVIPQEAVLIDDDGTYVWMAKDGRAVRQSVTTSDVNDRGTIISGGIAEGDRVIVNGQNKVSEGTKIKEIQ